MHYTKSNKKIPGNRGRELTYLKSFSPVFWFTSLPLPARAIRPGCCPWGCHGVGLVELSRAEGQQGLAGSCAFTLRVPISHCRPIGQLLESTGVALV